MDAMGFNTDKAGYTNLMIRCPAPSHLHARPARKSTHALRRLTAVGWYPIKGLIGYHNDIKVGMNAKRLTKTVEVVKPVEQMTSLDLGLAFAKECLVWKDANIQRKRIFHFDKVKSWVSFDPVNLGDVMQAVRDWLSAMDAYEAEEPFENVLSFRFGDFFLGAQDQSEVCHDLMATCVKTKRELDRNHV